MITAKVTCSLKDVQGDGENRVARVTFVPDYQDGRNAAPGVGDDAAR